jgi:aquaporin Z
MRTALNSHWPEYLMEMAEITLLLFALFLVNLFVEHPSSPIRQLIADLVLRRAVRAVLMGLVAISIVYSPLGQQSGAHLNPSITLTYFRLQKVRSWDALFYIVAQFLGGGVGVLLAALLLRGAASVAPIRYAATFPGSAGPAIAFAAECLIAFVLMSTVLWVSNTRSIARYTGICAGTLVATFILLESPLSGASLNPARSLASALAAQLWTALWIYFLAPPLGMLLAAQVYLWVRGDKSVICAKLHHHNDKRCIFQCGYHNHAAVSGEPERL